MFCPKCGAVIEEKDVNCITCGVKLADVLKAEQQGEPAPAEPSASPFESVGSNEKPPTADGNPWQQQTPPTNNPWQQQQEQAQGQWGGQPQADQWQGQSAPPIRSMFGLNLGFAIASLFCCNIIALPLFIVGAVMGKQAETLQARFTFDEAQSKVRTARILFFIGLGVFVIGFVYSIVFGMNMASFGNIYDIMNYYRY